MRRLRSGTPLQVRRCAEVSAAREAIPSDKELAKELGLAPRTVRWLVERARREQRRRTLP